MPVPCRSFSFPFQLLLLAITHPWASASCPCTVPLIPIGKGGDSCYLRGEVPVKWKSAEKICAERGGHLASITDDAVMALLTQKSNTSAGVYWTGGSFDGAWKWTDDSAFGSVKWYSGTWLWEDLCLGLTSAKRITCSKINPN